MDDSDDDILEQDRKNIDDLMDEKEGPEIIEKLLMLKENLYLHSHDIDVVEGISKDIDDIIAYIETKEKETDWVIIEVSQSSEVDYSYVEMMKKLSGSYMKLANVYNSTTSAISTVYNSVRPAIGITQLLLSFYHGGPIGSAVLLWSWCRK